MNILILHNMGPEPDWIATVAELELALPRYAETHKYIVHDAALPLPPAAKDFEYDAIILNSTFLGAVFHPKTLREARGNYGFIRDSGSVKVALPQDEYYCCEELDDLLVEWDIDLTYTVCPDGKERLFPRYINSGGILRHGFTGYITPKMISWFERVIPRSRRKYDVVYRASGQPYFPNKLAQQKAALGERFKRAYSGKNWRLDIPESGGGFLRGERWWKHIINSCVTIGSSSGSSQLIRNHRVVGKIEEYRLRHRGAGIDEIIRECLEPSDSSHNYTMISPRVIEAGLGEVAQLLVPDSYSDLLDPWEHYVPLDEDCSNKVDVIKFVESAQMQEQISIKFKERLLDYKPLRTHSLTSGIFEYIQNNSSFQDTHKKANEFKKMESEYNELMSRKYREHYFLQRIKIQAKNIIPDIFLKYYRKNKYGGV